MKLRLRHLALPMMMTALSLCSPSAFAQTPGSDDKPATTPAQPSSATPASPSGKATNRAAPVEPPSSEPSTPSAEIEPQTLGGAEPPMPAGEMRPVQGRPNVPVFVKPGVGAVTRGLPTPPLVPAPAAASSVKPGEPDWRVSRQPPEPAFAAYQRGRYVEALKEALAIVGKDDTNAAAMTLIGEIYRDGLGIKQDYAEALRWYRLADQRGDRQAAFAIARAYVEGAGVAQDFGKAKEFFERAAAQNHAAALYNLGIMAIEGEIQDYKKAAELFEKAMENGDLDATYSLAFLYRNGQGVPKDEERATALLKQAADQHHLPAMIDFAISLFNGRGIQPDEPGAAAYLLRAAWRNAPVAQNRLARMFVAGRGVKADLVEAMKWHVLARANGLKDEWLDTRLTQLTPSQREIVEEAVRKFAVK